MKVLALIIIVFTLTQFHLHSSWTELQIIVPNDIQDDDGFGTSIAIDGNYAVIGALNEDGAGSNRGAAYVFQLDDSNTWTQIAKLTASDAADGDWLGLAVAIDDDVIIVTAYFEDAGGLNSGSVYLYEKPGGGWTDMTETAKLTSTDLSATDYFGFRQIDIQNDVVVIGSYANDVGFTDNGTVYVFVKPGGGWVNMTETAILSASDSDNGDLFGGSLSIDNDVIVVGARKVDGAGTDRGALYVFEKPGGGWVNMTETAILTTSDAADNDEFADVVSIDNNVIVGASIKEDGSGTDRGAIYVFEKPSGSWVNATEDAKLTASDGMDGDYFGNFHIDGNTIVVGAYGADLSGSDRGAAYVFYKPTSGWISTTENIKLTASDASDDDQFGIYIYLENGNLLVTSNGRDGGGTDWGAVYYFSNTPDIYNLTSSNIEDTQAKLSSLINDNASSTTISFSYGLFPGNYSTTVTADNSPLSANSGTTTIFKNISDLSPSTKYYFMVTAWNSAGTAYSVESNFTTSTESITDFESDGISNIDEDNAPNFGDGNGDGIQDANQETVATLYSNICNDYITIEVVNCSNLTNVQEADAESSSEYIFPFGAVKFTVPCSNAFIKLYYHSANSLSGYFYRKKKASGKWFNFSNIVFGAAQVGDNTVATVSLTLKDGGYEDNDGEFNGVIVDPGGPVFLVPNTNIPIWNSFWSFIAIVTLPIIVYWLMKRRL